MRPTKEEEGRMRTKKGEKKKQSPGVDSCRGMQGCTEGFYVLRRTKEQESRKI